MAKIDLKLVTPAKGKLVLGSSSSFGPKSKLEAIPKNFLDSAVKVDAGARRASIVKSAVISALVRGHGSPPQQPLSALGGKAAPGSFVPLNNASKLTL